MELEYEEDDESDSVTELNTSTAWGHSDDGTGDSETCTLCQHPGDFEECIEIFKLEPAATSAVINDLAKRGLYRIIETILGLRFDAHCCAQHTSDAEKFTSKLRQFLESTATMHALSLALLSACVNGNEALVSVLAKGGVNLDESDVGGLTPLLEAYDHSNDVIVEKLLNFGAKIPQGIPKVHLYCMLGRDTKAIFHAALNAASVESRDHKGRLPIHIAASLGHASLVKECLELSPKSLFSKDNLGRTVLHFSARCGHDDVVELLITRGCKIDDHHRKDKLGRSPLHYASLGGHMPVILRLLEAGEKVDVRTKSHSTPLHFAARMHQLEAVVTLLKYGANPNSLDDKKCTPIYEACATSISDDVDKAYVVIEQIILLGGDCDRGKCNPLVEVKHERIMKLLLAHGGSVNSPSSCHYGMLPIHSACKQRNFTKLQMLVDAGSPIDATTGTGFTPLHFACLGNFVEGVQLLLAKNANTNLITKQGFAPMHYAAKHPSPESDVVQLLLARGANMNPMDMKGRTPFDILLNKAISTLTLSDKLEYLISGGCLLTSIENHIENLFNRRKEVAGELEPKWRHLFQSILFQTCGHVIELNSIIQSVAADMCDAGIVEMLRLINYRFGFEFVQKVHAVLESSDLSRVISKPVELKIMCRASIRYSLSQTVPKAHSGVTSHWRSAIGKVRAKLFEQPKEHVVAVPFSAIRPKDVRSLPVSAELKDFLLFRDPSETAITHL